MRWRQYFNGPFAVWSRKKVHFLLQVENFQVAILAIILRYESVTWLSIIDKHYNLIYHLKDRACSKFCYLKNKGFYYFKPIDAENSSQKCSIFSKIFFSFTCQWVNEFQNIINIALICRERKPLLNGVLIRGLSKDLIALWLIVLRKLISSHENLCKLIHFTQNTDLLFFNFCKMIRYTTSMYLVCR